MPLIPILTSIAGPLISDLIGGHHAAKVKAANGLPDSIGALTGAAGGWGLRLVAGAALYAYATNPAVRAGFDSGLAAMGRQLVAGVTGG